MKCMFMWYIYMRSWLWILNDSWKLKWLSGDGLRINCFRNAPVWNLVWSSQEKWRNWELGIGEREVWTRIFFFFFFSTRENPRLLARLRLWSFWDLWRCPLEARWEAWRGCWFETSLRTFLPFFFSLLCGSCWENSYFILNFTQWPTFFKQLYRVKPILVQRVL